MVWLCVTFSNFACHIKYNTYFKKCFCFLFFYFFYHIWKLKLYIKLLTFLWVRQLHSNKTSNAEVKLGAVNIYSNTTKIMQPLFHFQNENCKKKKKKLQTYMDMSDLVLEEVPHSLSSLVVIHCCVVSHSTTTETPTDTVFVCVCRLVFMGD